MLVEKNEKNVSTLWNWNKRLIESSGPEVKLFFFKFNSGDYGICPANKSQISDNGNFFLAKHSWAWSFIC